MKLLLDENLSRRLVRRLEDLFPDTVVWEFAKSNGYSIVTADSDFYKRVVLIGSLPKVIWLRGCDYTTAFAEDLIRSQAIRIAEFLKHPEQAVLILRRS